ncbi:MAG: hypothetical protein HZB99_02560 [Candidatus Harrisonbacteria bacterium]|nr:hypothetical protein [Candidatus Harrisonbacteria bacterium]
MDDSELRRELKNIRDDIGQVKKEASDKGHGLIIFWLFITMMASCSAEQKLSNVERKISSIDLDVSSIKQKIAR